MAKYLLIIPIIFLLVGCSNEKLEKVIKEKETINITEVQVCINAGGVPIRSHWDNRLKDCLFK
jgi:hypothetical protein